MVSREMLSAMEEKIHQKHRLEAKLRHLQKEERELQEGMEVYSRQAAEEQGDVDELTGRSLKSFLARLQKNTYQDRLTSSPGLRTFSGTGSLQTLPCLTESEGHAGKCRSWTRNWIMSWRICENWRRKRTVS